MSKAKTDDIQSWAEKGHIPVNNYLGIKIMPIKQPHVSWNSRHNYRHFAYTGTG